MQLERLERAKQYYSQDTNITTSVSYCDGTFFDVADGYKDILIENKLWCEQYEKKYQELEHIYKIRFKGVFEVKNGFIS